MAVVTEAYRQLDLRLRRIEGLLAMLVRNADVERDERDLDGEIAKAYRRGYLTGHHQRAAGDICDPDRALSRRRGHRSGAPHSPGDAVAVHHEDPLAGSHRPEPSSENPNPEVAR